MPAKFAVALRACCVAVALMLATAPAAESRQPSLVGATREQVLERLGEPRSNMVAGAREVLFFDHERVVLRDNVVIEVERIGSTQPRRAPPPAPTPIPAPEAETPAVDGDGQPIAPVKEAAEGESGSAPARATAPAVAASDPDAPLEIKAVRPAGSVSRMAPKSAAPVVPASAPTPTNEPPTVATAAAVAPPPAGSRSASQTASAPRATEIIPAASADRTAAVPQAAPAGEATKDEESVATEADSAKKTKAARTPRRRASEPEISDAADSVFTARSYVIALIVIVGGVGYIVWRYRQRQLELTASAVSHTPFSAPLATTGTGAPNFTAELLGKLEWKRFEELVAAYYSKTGVVAVRTKTGPSSPVHIKISWKGEPRPFACVQCVARPPALIDVKPLQELMTVLAAEDIRRGYVVTTGKFNVAARDFAEEKHLTLLPGDIFLEKLNALPDPARAELMQEITTGDFTTPSCPKCEAKMTRSPEDAAGWRCAAHPEVVLPPRG